MSQPRRPRVRPPASLRGAGRAAGLGLLAVTLALPAPALAQVTPGTPSATASATPVPGTAVPVTATPTPEGTPTPIGSATPGGTATPRPVIVPECGPGMAGLPASPGGQPAPVIPASTAPAAPLRPTIPPAPTRVPSPTATLAPGVTPSPEPTRRPSYALVQEMRGLARDLVAELYRIDQDLVAAASTLRQAEDDLLRLASEIAVLEAELALKQAAVDARSAVYGTRLRAIYKFTRTSPLEEILSSRSFGDLLHRMGMLQAVARVDNRLLGQLRAERDALLATANALREKRQEVADLKVQIEEQQRLLLVRRDEQAVAVARAQREQSQVEAALAAQQASALAGRILAMQVQYGRELETLERQRPTAVPVTRVPATPTRPAPTATPPPPVVSGTPGAATPSPAPTRLPLVLPAGFRPLLWPISNAVVTTEFGEATFAQVFHSGIDLAQRLYAPVLAAEDGIVIACGYAVPGERSLSYGLFLVLAHDRTVSTLYAHLDDELAAPPVRVGNLVRRGQVLGYVGLTGLTTGPHLHFEVRAGGQIYDPRDFLTR